MSNLTATQFTTNGTFTLGRYFTAHPNYGIAGSSATENKYNATLVSNNGQNYGLFPRMLIKRVRMKFTIRNHEAFAVRVTILPIPAINVTTFAVSDYAQFISTLPRARNLTLSQAGVAGCVRSVSVSWDTADLEGISESALQQTSYWQQQSVVGGLYNIVYLQAIDIGNAGSFTTANGLSVLQESFYDCAPVGGVNVTTLL